jgi:pyridoxamine 5'-phosphate oxidase
MENVDPLNPFTLFEAWQTEANATEPNDPTAVAVATSTKEGLPSLRMVLMRGVDGRGFVFYSNSESRKGIELAANPRAALLFHWKSLRRQVRVEGPVEIVDDEEADAYFRGRPRGSQIGAWASDQSRPLASRALLEKRVAETEQRFGTGDVGRPPHWLGYRVVPHWFEFWEDRPFRLHDRLVYEPAGDGVSWKSSRLYP